MPRSDTMVMPLPSRRAIPAEGEHTNRAKSWCSPARDVDEHPILSVAFGQVFDSECDARGRAFSMPGGGEEMQFMYRVPSRFLSLEP